MEERTVTVIVTGSRAFSLSFRVYKALDDLFAEYGKVHLRVGDCPTGADLYTRRWAEKFPEKVASVQVFAADWAKHGRAAGPIRNREMAQSEPKADVCLAFMAGGEPNRGTLDCMAACHKAGIGVLAHYE